MILEPPKYTRTYTLFPYPTLFRSLTRACSTASSALGLTAGAAPYSNQIRWVIGFVAACIVLVGATLLVLWTVAGFGDLGVSGHGLVALILGIVFTTALGIGLMALSFYGDHSDQPEESRRSDATVERDAESRRCFAAQQHGSDAERPDL